MAKITVGSLLEAYNGTNEDDIFIFPSGTDPAYFTGAINGGVGRDQLVINGSVDITAGTLIDIEAVQLNQGSLFRITPAQNGAKPAFDLLGEGNFVINLIEKGVTTSQIFDGSGIVVAADARISIAILGGDKSNMLTGTQANDTVSGGWKADILKGLGGSDLLFGQDGNDMLLGGDGADFLIGGRGNDILAGGEGVDEANYSDFGIPNLSGAGVTVDLRIVGAAQDTGIAGHDTLLSIENVTGSHFDDILRGNAETNALRGLFGDDVLTGGAGADYLAGGSGADRFVYEKLSDSPTGLLARDIILDFNALEGDRIDLSAIDANIHVAGDQAFFLGGVAFTKHAGEIIQVQSGNDLKILADANGDGVADMAIYLQNVISLDATAFVL